MTTTFTLDSASKLLKDGYAKEPKLLRAVDHLLGAAIVLTPAAFGPAGAPALALLGTKNELVRICKELYDKLTAKTPDAESEVLSRQHRMALAYCIVTYAAFFDGLDHVLAELRAQASLPEDAGLQFSRTSGMTPDSAPTALPIPSSAEPTPTTLYDLRLPHPIDDFDTHCEQLAPLYDVMAKGATSLIESTSAWLDATEPAQDTIRTALAKLPAAARRRFRAHYHDLALRFPDFYVWASLHEHEVTRTNITRLSDQVTDLSTFVQSSITLATSDPANPDFGLAALANAVNTLPATLDRHDAMHVIGLLHKAYANRIDRPIIEDSFTREDGHRILLFPKKQDIFIPQSYRTLRPTRANQRLEDEETWERAEARDTLAAFIFRYLSSPYSLEGPLVILGHPGSGKSLLTEILAARLSSDHLTTFRVELRDIDAESEIDAQIVSQIHADTSSTTSWDKLRKELNNPPVVILDGYDELLQASGRVFRNYLNKVKNFQEREHGLDRPVRVIVTSRITLIDKADIPPETTIVRLEEFDTTKQDHWIRIWNRTNAQYFEDNLQPFSLPADPKLRPLAAQPLLLLMLALYDSSDNQLGQSEDLDQTRLYHSLLTRFVERERLKGEAGHRFRDMPQKDRDSEVERDMQRLGVAAIGMFNRRSLHILTDQLNKDVEFFGLGRCVDEPIGGVAMTQADLLLGSFFFIHESKNRRPGDQSEPDDTAKAFEFLHNTFGEFLTSDFILHAILTVTANLRDHRLSESLQRQLADRLAGPSAFPRRWYGCLIFTPLYTRPVVLHMLREWFTHSLARVDRSRDEVLRDLDIVVSNQIKRILTEDQLPEMLPKQGDGATPVALGQLGHMATYSLNLLVLRTVLDVGTYEFDENGLGQREEGARPWDRLTHLWRSWFSIDSLRGLATIWTAQRVDSKVLLTARQNFGEPFRGDRLEAVHRVSLALADGIGAGLAGFAASSRYGAGHDSLKRSGALLCAEGIDVRLQLLLRQLQSPMRRFLSYEARARMVDEAWHLSTGPEGSWLQLTEIASIAEGEDSVAVRWRELEQVLMEAGHDTSDAAEATVLLWQLLAKTGLATGPRLFDEEVTDRLLSVVFERKREWRGGGLVELVRLARGGRGLRSVEDFVSWFFRRDPHEVLLLGELGPEGVVEVLRFAGEAGEFGWFKQGLRAIGRQLAPDAGRYYGTGDHEDLALVSKVGAVAFEYGLEQRFAEVFEPLVRRMWGRGRGRPGRMAANSRFDGEVLGKFVTQGDWLRLVGEGLGPRALSEMPPEGVAMLLGWRGGRGGGALADLMERDWERWIGRVPGGLRRRAVVTLGVAYACRRFSFFSRRFTVGKIAVGDGGDRWTIVLERPKGTLVLRVNTLSVQTANAFRWMLQELGCTELAVDFDKRLTWRPDDVGQVQRESWLARVLTLFAGGRRG